VHYNYKGTGDVGNNQSLRLYANWPHNINIGVAHTLPTHS